jgi:hypothetical protein
VAFYHKGYIIRVRKQTPVGLYCLICNKNGGVVKRIPNIDTKKQAEEVSAWYIDKYLMEDLEE